MTEKRFVHYCFTASACACPAFCVLQELWFHDHVLLAALATGFTAVPHVLMSLLLIVRQGWLQAASQACGFILTLNPFESLTPIPEGLLGLLVLAVGFIAYVLIAASGGVLLSNMVVASIVVAFCFKNAPLTTSSTQSRDCAEFSDGPWFLSSYGRVLACQFALVLCSFYCGGESSW